jgi:hypothetical protein
LPSVLTNQIRSLPPPPPDLAYTMHEWLQVENNHGKDFRLKLIDAPTEDEVLEKRVAAYEAAEAARKAEIDAAEAKVLAAAEIKRAEVSADAMHAWWEARRATVWQQVQEEVSAQLDGTVDGACDAIEVRRGHRYGSAFFACLPQETPALLRLFVGRQSN